MVTAKAQGGADSRMITRNSSHFKMVNVKGPTEGNYDSENEDNFDVPEISTEETDNGNSDIGPVSVTDRYPKRSTRQQRPIRFKDYV